MPGARGGAGPGRGRGGGAGDRDPAAGREPGAARLGAGAGRPVLPEADRAYLLVSLRAVDGVVVFSEDTPEELVDTLVPDVLVKGGDYAPDQVMGRDTVEAAGGEVRILPLEQGCKLPTRASGFAERLSRCTGGSRALTLHYILWVLQLTGYPSIDGVANEAHVSTDVMFGIATTRGMPVQVEAGDSVSDSDDLEVDLSGCFGTASSGTVVVRALEGGS